MIHHARMIPLLLSHVGWAYSPTLGAKPVGEYAHPTRLRRIAVAGIRLAILAAFLAACSGCGLVPFPYSRELPGAFKGIRVLDVRTGEDIPDAEVTVGVWKFENWIKTFPPHASPHPQTANLQVQRRTDQVFHVKPTRFTAWARPWGVGPLGTTIYNDFGTTVRVQANGYDSVVLSYYPEAPIAPESVPKDLANAVAFDNSGNLVLRLKALEMMPP